jgi:hypothetical protein
MMRYNPALSRLKPQFEFGWGHTRKNERIFSRSFFFKVATLFGNLAIMTSKLVLDP